MKRLNSSKSQTDYYSARNLVLLSAVLLGFLAVGCTGSSFSSQEIWDKTKSTARSAYIKTERAVSNTLITIGKYQRDHAYGRDDSVKPQKTEAKNNSNPAPRPAETTRTDDRFPSRAPAATEENLRPGQARQITRNTTPKEMPLPPRTTMSLEELRQRIRDIEQERIRSTNPADRRRLAAELKELERMLLTYQNEENIIEEMTQLRNRLRKLQEDLLDIQQTNR